jgi:hypothetical protein
LIDIISFAEPIHSNDFLLVFLSKLFTDWVHFKFVINIIWVIFWTMRTLFFTPFFHYIHHNSCKRFVSYILTRYFISQPKVVIFWKKSHSVISAGTTFDKVGNINKIVEHNTIIMNKSKCIDIFGYSYFIVLTFVHNIEHLLLNVTWMVKNLRWSVIHNLLLRKLIEEVKSTHWLQFQHFGYVWCLVFIFYD